MRAGARGEEIHSPLVVSLLEPTLLVLIKEQPGHGYSLLSKLSDLDITTIHASVVYRTLREMETLEWIDSDWDTDQTQGPPRRTYRLTAQGEEALRYWTQELEKTNLIIDKLFAKIQKV
jgi:poly-beta-hydroxybutyrate-responsive repressor